MNKEEENYRILKEDHQDKTSWTDGKGSNSPGGKSEPAKGVTENPEQVKNMIQREAPAPGGAENAAGAKNADTSQEDHTTVGAPPVKGYDHKEEE